SPLVLHIGIERYAVAGHRHRRRVRVEGDGVRELLGEALLEGTAPTRTREASTSQSGAHRTARTRRPVGESAAAKEAERRIEGVEVVHDARDGNALVRIDRFGKDPDS